MNRQMEIPKDYSCEDMTPVPATRASGKKLDGGFAPRRHRESGGIDPNELVYRLHNLSKEEHHMYAMDSLKQHYNSVFQKRRQRVAYKVYLTYYTNGERETYIVRVERNRLRDVKNQLPIKGSFRFFFIHDNEAEEIEDEEVSLPYCDKDGNLAIYCRLFPK